MTPPREPINQPRRFPEVVPGPSLSDQVAVLLKERILAGELVPGERLIESALASELGLSRAPVREALQQLLADGLATHDDRRGVRVATVTVRDVADICQLRAAIEGKAGQLVAAQGVDITPLRNVLDGMFEAARAGDPRRVIELDLRFHELICELSGNKRIHAAFLNNAPILRTIFLLDVKLVSLQVMADEHVGIIEAIESADEAAIQRAIDRHMEMADRLMRKYLGEKPSAEPVRRS